MLEERSWELSRFFSLIPPPVNFPENHDCKPSDSIIGTFTLDSTFKADCGVALKSAIDISRPTAAENTA